MCINQRTEYTSDVIAFVLRLRSAISDKAVKYSYRAIADNTMLFSQLFVKILHPKKSYQLTAICPASVSSAPATSPRTDAPSSPKRASHLHNSRGCLRYPQVGFAILPQVSVSFRTLDNDCCSTDASAWPALAPMWPHRKRPDLMPPVIWLRKRVAVRSRHLVAPDMRCMTTSLFRCHSM